MIIWTKAVAIWFGILVLAVINGVVRDKLLVHALGQRSGLLSSGIVLSSCVAIVAWAALPWIGTLRPIRYWAIGVLWLSLTLVFEFGLGHFVLHKSLQAMLAAYTFEGGNLWPLVLLSTLVSPRLAAFLRGFA